MSSGLFEDDVVFLQRLLKSAGFYQGSIDGIWGPLTDAAVNAFDARCEELAGTLGSFDARTERNILTLHPKAQELARIFMKRLLDAGINARIISGTRTYAEQNELFKRGRFGNPGPKVTNARGGQSNHNFCIAWDIGIFEEDGAYLGDSPLYDTAAEVGLVDGIEWGGHWTSFVDRPHYQAVTGLKISAVRVRFERGQLSI